MTNLSLLSPHLTRLGSGHEGPLSKPLNQLSPQLLSSSLLPVKSSLSPQNRHPVLLGERLIGLLSRFLNQLSPQPLNTSFPPPQFPLSPHFMPLGVGHKVLQPKPLNRLSQPPDFSLLSPQTNLSHWGLLRTKYIDLFKIPNKLIPKPLSSSLLLPQINLSPHLGLLEARHVGHLCRPPNPLNLHSLNLAPQTSLSSLRPKLSMVRARCRDCLQ